MIPAHIVLIEDNLADVLLIELVLTESSIVYELTRYANDEDAVRSLCDHRSCRDTGSRRHPARSEHPAERRFRSAYQIQEVTAFRCCAYRYHHILAGNQ